MNWNLIKLHKFVKNENQVIKFLKDKKLLKSEMNCDQCHPEMHFNGTHFRCQKTNVIKNGRVK